MSYQATQFVINLRDLTPSQKAVAHALAHHANQDGENSFPSIETIADESGLKRRATQYVVRQLEHLGIIAAVTAKTGGCQTTRYRINMSLNSVPQYALSTEESSLGGATQCAPSAEGGVQPSAPGGATQCAGGVQPSARRGATHCTRIVLNSPYKSKSNKKPPPVLSLSSNQKPSAIEQRESIPKVEATPEAKKLCRQIQSYLLETYDVTLTGKGRDELLTSISETQLYPAEIWYFAVDELIYALDHTDNDGFARNQAGSRVPATLAIAFEPTSRGSPTVVDRYYENKSQPFIMARQQVQMRKEADERIAACHKHMAEQDAEVAAAELEMDRLIAAG